jgi:hypothetical protein
MSVENPLWGAPRIHGELLKLEFEVAQSSVAKYMVKRRGPPSQAWRCEGSAGAVGPSSSPGPSGPAGLTICKQIRHLPFRETNGIPDVSQGALLAAILQSARTMQQIMNANVLERRLRINLKCLNQHTAIAALAHGT